MKLNAHALQPTTLSTYWSGVQRFKRFLHETGNDIALFTERKPSKSLSPESIMLFIVWARKRFAPTTVLSTIAALRRWHGENDQHYPGENRALKDLTNLVKKTAKARTVKTAKSPYPHSLIPLILRWIDIKTREPGRMTRELARDGALLVIGFYALLRRSKIWKLRIRDVQLRSVRGVECVSVHIQRSKNDTAGRGANIYLAATTRSGVNIAYVVKIHLANMLGVPVDSPLFQKARQGRWCGAYAGSDFVNRRLQALHSALARWHPNWDLKGLHLTAHSLRVGGATWAEERGVPRDLLMTHGRWLSDAVDIYRLPSPRD